MPKIPDSIRTPALTEKDPIPFGKYKGTALGEVNLHYLNWLWNNGMHKENKPVANYIRDRLDDLIFEDESLNWVEDEL